MLVDGELFFEHILHENHADKGILGVVEIPTEVMDPIYDNIQNKMLKGFILRRPVLNTQTGQTEKIEYVPFDQNQITYVHSEVWNEDQSTKFCWQTYFSLS